MPADQLTTPDESWSQFVIEVADRETGEQVAADHLRPALATAEDAGLIRGWWYTRKHPHWRLRYRPTDPSAEPGLAQVLDKLRAEERIVGWTRGIYEPEVYAFGGTASMAVAHELFTADSRSILSYLTGPPIGRREVTMLLCSTLLRAAGLDWYEQGDVWATVAEHRPADLDGLSAARRASLDSDLRRLMTTDTGATSPLVKAGPLTPLSGWFAAFDQAGRELASLTRTGRLQRGLRAVLAHHVIFHWNRLGLASTEQALLAALATQVVMADRPTGAAASHTGVTS